MMINTWSKNGEKNGEYRFFSDFMASLLRYMIGMVELVSDVSCRYSLSTNPRGAKDYSLVIIGLIVS